jgi:hypothetical protein
MPYKTIILELLEDQPATYERLRRQRQLLVTIANVIATGGSKRRKPQRWDFP